jgi:hypothetical protein
MSYLPIPHGGVNRPQIANGRSFVTNGRSPFLPTVSTVDRGVEGSDKGEMYICQPWISGVVEKRTYIERGGLTLPYSATAMLPTPHCSNHRGKLSVLRKDALQAYLPWSKPLSASWSTIRGLLIRPIRESTNKITAAVLPKPRRGAEARPPI